MERLNEIEDNSIDAIFADPPYFLSNGGISVHSGKQVCVDKGDWDKGGTPEYIYNFNRQWLSLCRTKLKDNGTIWVSGTHHNIHVVMRCLQKLGYKVLNTITWQKSDPPPNLSCKYFNFSTELVIWARKHEKKTHKFNYEVMKRLNGGSQMTDVWRIPAVGLWEKLQGKHPTQKPLRLLYRIILASTNEGDTILDPFSGSGTTGIAANLLGRKYDSAFKPNNSLFYCSELIHYVYKEQFGIELCKFRKVKSYNTIGLKEILKKRHISLEQEVVAPIDIYDSEYAHNI